MQERNITTLYVYHYAIRYTRLLGSDLQKPSLSNNDCYFWGEAKKLRLNKSLCSNVFDVCKTYAEIADFCAHKYQDLYTSVPFNVNDMEEIRSDISASMQDVSVFSRFLAQ